MDARMNRVEAIKFFRDEDLKDYLEAKSLMSETRNGTKMDDVTLYIEENQSVLCDTGEIYGPLDLYVSVHENWNALEKFMAYINEIYRDPKQEEPVIQLKHIHEGCYVALLYNEEWHRGKVLYLNEDKEKCQVLLVDYGTRVIRKPAELKRLHPNAFNLMAQAIHCRLSFPEWVIKFLAGSEKSPGRRTEIAKSLTDIVANKKLLVTFKKLVKDKNDEFIWEINAHIPKTDDPKEVYLESGLLQHILIDELHVQGLI